MSDPVHYDTLLAHGLDAGPMLVADSVLAAVEALQAKYYPLGGDSGLSAAEAQVAREGGLEPASQLGAADPLLQGVAAFAALLETGLDTAAAARQLGVSDARIRQRIQEGSLFAIKSGRGWILPVFQFVSEAHGGELPGWRALCLALPSGVSPIAVERWLSHAHPALSAGPQPASPRDWLLAGRDPSRVAELAAELA